MGDSYKRVNELAEALRAEVANTPDPVMAALAVHEVIEAVGHHMPEWTRMRRTNMTKSLRRVDRPELATIMGISRQRVQQIVQLPTRTRKKRGEVDQ